LWVVDRDRFDTERLVRSIEDSGFHL
jgi:hypothetical protein